MKVQKIIGCCITTPITRLITHLNGKIYKDTSMEIKRHKNVSIPLKDYVTSTKK